MIDRAFEIMAADSDDVIEPSAREAYRAAFRDPAVQHAICEDYRSALDEDLAHDQDDHDAGRKLDCPVLVLWPGSGSGDGAVDGATIWKQWADDVTAVAIGGGHLQPEDRPDDVANALIAFFSREPRTASPGSMVQR